MSYRLIDANDLNGKISAEDYEVVLKEPCIYADLPNGMDGKGYEVISWEKIPKDATNGDVIKAMFPNASIYEGHGYGYVYSDVVRISENYMMTYDIDWWNAKYKGVK